MRSILLSVLLFQLSFGTLFSQNTEQADSSAFSKDQIPSIENFDPAAATDSYLNSISEEERLKSDKYFEGDYWHLLWGILIEVLLAMVFLSFGLSRWMKKMSQKVKNGSLQDLIYIGFYILFSFLLTLPYSIYVDFIREHAFDLSNLSFGGWFKEELISLAISLVFLSLLLLLIYYAIRKTKEKWWIWAGGISTAFIVLSIFIFPVFIAPIFNNYTELPESELRNDILSLARANSIPTDHVYQFDASKQTKRVSANVSGIGKTIRISLNDNLLNRCSPEEIKAVVAHEMGHYVLNHIPKFIVFFGLLLFLGFALTHIVFKRICNRWGEKLNISGLSDIGGLPLFMVILSFFMFLSTPITNNIIRTAEVEADIFGLNASREPDGFAGAIMMTSEYRKIDPGHWEEIIFFDHPSPRSRIFMAMKWKAENLEE